MILLKSLTVLYGKRWLLKCIEYVLGSEWFLPINCYRTNVFAFLYGCLGIEVNFIYFFNTSR